MKYKYRNSLVTTTESNLIPDLKYFYEYTDKINKLKSALYGIVNYLKKKTNLEGYEDQII